MPFDYPRHVDEDHPEIFQRYMEIVDRSSPEAVRRFHANLSDASAQFIIDGGSADDLLALTTFAAALGAASRTERCSFCATAAGAQPDVPNGGG